VIWLGKKLKVEVKSLKRALRFVMVIALIILARSAYAAGGACPTGVPVTGNNCYFVAAAGSDSNNGTSESTPWIHAPGMPNCTNVCKSTRLAAGNGVIFRGGDTWHFGKSSASPYTGGTLDLHTSLFSSGDDAKCVGSPLVTSGCIYYGVDQSWYTGSSWTRPIFTGDNPTSNSNVASCAYQIPNTPPDVTNTLVSLARNVYFDNFELTGLCVNASSPTSGTTGTYIAYLGTGISGFGTVFETNLYIHGWTATSAAGTGNNTIPVTVIGGGNGGLQNIFSIVVDGSDSLPGVAGWGTFPSFYHFKDSIIRYVTQGVGQFCHDIHDNIFEHFFNPSVPTHGNTLECNDDNPGTATNQPQNTPNVFYNNIVRHDDAGFSTGNPRLWFCPEGVPEYWFNNLQYDLTAGVGQNWDYAGPTGYSCSNTGGQFMFNNTIVGGSQPCHISTVNHGGKYLTVLNEQLINTPFDSGPTACGSLSDTSNIAQTVSAAVSQGYLVAGGTGGTGYTCANESTSPCSPTQSGNSTVGTGHNEQAYCTKLASYTSEPAIGTDAANACKYGTTDACVYNSGTHSMNCSVQRAVGRPISGPWTSGAPQFSGVSAPTNLSGTPVHN
jgi:hypothetical protein